MIPKIYKGICAYCSTERAERRDLKLIITEDKKEIKCLDCGKTSELVEIFNSSLYELKRNF